MKALDKRRRGAAEREGEPSRDSRRGLALPAPTSLSFLGALRPEGQTKACGCAASAPCGCSSKPARGRPLAATRGGNTTFAPELAQHPQRKLVEHHEAVHRSQFEAFGTRPTGSRSALEADADRGAQALDRGHAYNPRVAAPPGMTLFFDPEERDGPATTAWDGTAAPDVLQPTPDAFEGIEFTYMVTELPATRGANPSHGIRVGPFLLMPQLDTLDANVTPRAAYYLAYHEQSGIWAYYVGPESVQSFIDNVDHWNAVGGLAYMFGYPNAWNAASARSAMAFTRGEFGTFAREFANAWGAALTDPSWYAHVAMVAAGSLPRAVPARPPSGPGGQLIGTATRPAVGAVEVATVEVRSLAATGTDGVSAVASPARAMASQGAQVYVFPARAPAPATAPAPAPTVVAPSALQSAMAAASSLGTYVQPGTAPNPQPKRQAPDACAALWSLPRGTNARWWVQRPPINGHTTVSMAAFRLDAGVPIPAGQDTTAASRQWARSIGFGNEDAGHVIRKTFGGFATFNQAPDGNIFPQNLSYNRGYMNSFDNVARDAYRAGNDVCVNVVLEYASATDTRPTGVLFTFMIRPRGGVFTPPIGPARLPNPP